MKTAERASALATALATFEGWAQVRADDLTALVGLELGHPGALDGFRPYGSIRSTAMPVSPLLHVLSGNTPAAAVQSLVRGVLLGTHNLVKLPSRAPDCDRAVREFAAALPERLAGTLEIRSDLPDDWLAEAGGVIAFGSDETVGALRKRVRGDQVFQAHGHALSFGVVFAEPTREAVRAAALDIAQFDQAGCLSLHDIYVAGGSGPARAYAEALASELAAFDGAARPAPAGAAAEIANLRSGYRFRAASDPEVAIWSGEGSQTSTVIYESEPQFALSPGYRTVFVKPLPPSMGEPLQLVRPHLSTVAIHPFEEAFTEVAMQFGASRVCRFGDSQRPSLFWHQDGLPALSPFVRFTDLG